MNVREAVADLANVMGDLIDHVDAISGHNPGHGSRMNELQRMSWRARAIVEEMDNLGAVSSTEDQDP